MTFNRDKRESRPAFISPESRIPISIAMSGIGGAIVTTAAACALWYHMDAALQNKVSLAQFQGFAVQLQTDNPQLKVKIPGIDQMTSGDLGTNSNLLVQSHDSATPRFGVAPN